MEKPSLKMTISLNVLEHLGFKMYTSLPAVIAEYVANSWDGGASRVDVTVPEGSVTENFAITIEDDGTGMSEDDLNKKFLVVGRNRRKDEGTAEVTVRGKTRRIMGRKGLGKLAGFGVAGLVEVNARRDGRFIQFELDYDVISKRLDENQREVPTTYEPEVANWGSTERRDGTTVTLKRLKRTRAPYLTMLRRNLARHFSVIGTDYGVYVNGKRMTPAERDLQKICQWTWPIDDFVDQEKRLRVTGWIGTSKKPISRDEGRGITVMARGKLVEEPKEFLLGKGVTGQIALAYIVGEVNANFLDEAEDLVATGRRSVIWERSPASELRDWLNVKIRDVCGEWAKKQREEKLEVIRDLPIYKKRIERLPRRERRIIDTFLAKMAGREDVGPDTIVEVASYVASSVEYKVFLDLVQTIDDADVAKPEELIQFFNEWEVLDAVELLRIYEGRKKTIDKFQELIETGAKEVPDLHNFLKDNPWLLDPTWDYVDDEASTRKMMLEKFPEAESVPVSNQRIDFLCLGHGNILNVIELKRPGSSVGRKELEQLERYVDFVDEMQGSDPKLAKTVVGYIIAGKISRTQGVRSKVKRLEKDSMYVRTFDSLREVAHKVYVGFAKAFESKAKRTGDMRLEEGVLRLKKELEVTGE